MTKPEYLSYCMYHVKVEHAYRESFEDIEQAKSSRFWHIDLLQPHEKTL